MERKQVRQTTPNRENVFYTNNQRKRKGMNVTIVAMQDTLHEIAKKLQRMQSRKEASKYSSRSVGLILKILKMLRASRRQ